MNTFDPTLHKYYVDDVELPSVTGILSAAGVSDYRKIPQDILQRAAAFGIAVHRAVELSIKGTLDMDSLDPALEHPLNEFKRFISDYDCEMVEAERRLYFQHYGYAGTLDAVIVPRRGDLGGKTTLLDIKTGVVLFSVRLQTAAYQLAYEHETKKKIKARICLKLPMSGGYVVHPLKAVTDKAEWLHTLSYYQMMKREKLSMWGV